MKSWFLLFLKLICKTSILEIISDLQNIGLGIPRDGNDSKTMEQTKLWREYCNDSWISEGNFISITHLGKTRGKGRT